MTSQNIATLALVFLILSGLLSCSAPGTPDNSQIDDRIRARVDSLMALMTLEEKIGQLNHLKGSYSTDIYEQDIDLDEELRKGHVGALTPGVDMEQLRQWQKLVVEKSRLGIPLLYAADIIHGYRTVFPIPLGQAASWNLNAIEKAEHISAIEATAAGFNWTFAPMVDVARDARWGRWMEGSGEDTHLGCAIARARIRGFQGTDLALDNTMLATAKHFAAYGAAEGGREYNTADLSERVLREVYLPPFKAAVDQGAASIMNAFNVVNRIPASAHGELLNDILKGEWQFEGFTVSDANSFYELIPHGVAANGKEAALKCIQSGADMDLWGQIYIGYLQELVEEGSIKESLIDASVRRILAWKFKLGIMDDPYKYLEPTRLDSVILHPRHLIHARELARESFVLLKNDHQLLPLDSTQNLQIALIGDLAASREFKDMMGNWSGFGQKEDVVTLYDALEQELPPGMSFSYVQGCQAWGKCTEKGIREAVKIAQKSDVVLLAIGENGWASGECSSTADITLPGNQEKLVEALEKTGKPIIALIFNGRPLVLTEVMPSLDAALLCWQPGIQGGPALCDVLLGKYNPSGKLPMSLPYHIGQLPIYYNYLNTGRPRLSPEDTDWGKSKYADIPNEPLYPFGYGLSYTRFEYGEIMLEKAGMSAGDTLKVQIELKNTGDRNGEEVVQLYIRDVVAQVSRPVKELKDFRKVSLAAGESKVLEFFVTVEQLKYWNQEMKFEADPGEFVVMIGGDSETLMTQHFYLQP